MCGELNSAHIGQEVVLNGWIQRRRNLGGLIFCDLRDKTGIVQIVFNQDVPEELFKKADSLRSEFVVGVQGTVKERQSKNKDLPTGDIEVFVDDLVIYSQAETPPIYIKDDDDVSENLRMKYRYLDLRKPRMQGNLQFRHKVTKLTRDFFDSCGFTEIETPMLIKPTPEGARDYLVPSRVNRGRFYALPQSPQMFKQLLMVSGADRYFQIVKCFRDEDLRADRQPEFTQIDIEMSFVDVDDVIEVQEKYLQQLFSQLMGIEISLPLPRITHQEAMERYGSDKPDTRFGFELRSLIEKVKDSPFPMFANAIAEGGDVRAININGYSADFSRKDLDRLQDEIKKTFGAKGLAWIRVGEDEITSSFNKFYDQEGLRKLAETVDGKPGDLILIVAGEPGVVFDSLGYLRREIADRMGLLDDNVFNLLWVVDFPLLEYDHILLKHFLTSPIQRRRFMYFKADSVTGAMSEKRSITPVSNYIATHFIRFLTGEPCTNCVTTSFLSLQNNAVDFPLFGRCFAQCYRSSHIRTISFYDTTEVHGDKILIFQLFLRRNSVRKRCPHSGNQYCIEGQPLGTVAAQEPFQF
jgi:aspartyl-tRNA synthetase